MVQTHAIPPVRPRPEPRPTSPAQPSGSPVSLGDDASWASAPRHPSTAAVAPFAPPVTAPVFIYRPNGKIGAARRTGGRSALRVDIFSLLSVPSWKEILLSDICLVDLIAGDCFNSLFLSAGALIHQTERSKAENHFQSGFV